MLLQNLKDWSVSTKGLEEASTVTGVTEFRLPEGSILTSIRWVLTPREPWRHFWPSPSLAACTCHSCHLGSSPGTDNSGSEPACKDTSAGELLPRDHTLSPRSDRSFPAGLTLPGRSPSQDPAQRRAGLKPCCHRYCVIASCRDSRSFPKLEYSSPVGELGWAKKTKSQARSAPAMATACRRGKRTFCHAGWEAGSCRQLHF